jgi:hypothetical protein
MGGLCPRCVLGRAVEAKDEEGASEDRLKESGSGRQARPAVEPPVTALPSGRKPGDFGDYELLDTIG